MIPFLGVTVSNRDLRPSTRSYILFFLLFRWLLTSQSNFTLRLLLTVTYRMNILKICTENTFQQFPFIFPMKIIFCCYVSRVFRLMWYRIIWMCYEVVGSVFRCTQPEFASIVTNQHIVCAQNISIFFVFSVRPYLCLTFCGLGFVNRIII